MVYKKVLELILVAVTTPGLGSGYREVKYAHQGLAGPVTNRVLHRKLKEMEIFDI